jgi:hypothetical protein
MTLLITPDKNLAETMVSTGIFCAPSFRAILAREFRLEAVHLHLSMDRQTLIIPAFLRRHGWGKKSIILGAGFDKTGTIDGIDADNYAQTIAQLLQALGTTDIDALEIRTTHPIPCLSDTADKVEPNIDIPITTEALWDSLAKKTRSNIRRTLKHGFTSTIGTSPELLDTFYQLYRLSLHNLGSLPHPKPFFADLLAKCPTQAAIFIGYMDGVPVVSSFNLLGDDEIYFAWAGRNPAYKQHDPFLTMLWKMTEYCAATGRKTYNLGRSSQGTNPYFFKLKLANRVNKLYYYQLKVNHPKKPVAWRKSAAWLIRNTPETVMTALSRTLIHQFY